MRRNSWLALVGVELVLGAGCSSEGDDDASGGSTEAMASDDSDEGVATAVGGGGAAADGGGVITPVIDASAQLVGEGRSVIRTAELEVRAEDVGVAARAAVGVAERSGGFLAAEESEFGDDASARLVLKVLPERFTASLTELGELGEIVSQRVGSDDVTEVVVDLEGRLAAVRASVERLRELLGEAGDVNQIVAVESELARREGEVESLAGQLRSLESQVDLATITVQLTVPPAAASPSVSEDIPGFLAGLRTGWVAFVNVVGGAATVVGFALPFAALAALVGIPALWWRRRSSAAAA